MGKRDPQDTKAGKGEKSENSKKDRTLRASGKVTKPAKQGKPEKNGKPAKAGKPGARGTATKGARSKGRAAAKDGVAATGKRATSAGSAGSGQGGAATGTAHDLTARYEAWLAAHFTLVQADLDAKHMLLSSDVFAFLRGTYYLWLVRATQEAPECFRAPRVPLVGDLHVANFGTWLDADGVARWGVNDFDELADGPYPLDLLRLATSWNLAQTKVPLREACDILWDTWRRAVPDLPAVSLSDPAHAHLERLLPLREANRYTKLEALPDAVRVPAAAIAAVSGTVPEGWAPTWHPRRAGVGSLGHPRFDGVGAGPDGRVLAREAKLLGPGACGWVAVQPECGVPTTVLPLGREACYRDVQANIAGPAVAIRLAGWQVRRLAPDVRMIDVTKLGDHADERVLRAMARATASVHGPALPAAQAHAATLPSGWLYDATRRMSASVRADHAAYVKAVPSPSAR